MYVETIKLEFSIIKVIYSRKLIIVIIIIIIIIIIITN